MDSRLLIPLIIVCSLFTAACGTASGSTAKEHNPTYTPEPWNEIARGGTARLLLIDVFQGTRDRSSPCYVRYRTRVVAETAHVVKIELLRPPPPREFGCAAIAVRGPFFVRVVLKSRYHRQSLIDAVTGRRYTLTSLSHFS